ncbi:cobalt-precorrin-6A reductase [Anabaena sp. FACHB-1237]|uniref:cobalt-precorrin-6A reductase n=1 Tax=Anabaena sp. FACHB-1237 TaxID=2692769 RepID=UPI0016817488|nr:cobalt-precorrin-6A reductase [Anabaena sp. FACHB-1237]MBD2136784.1 cobalt-precorrin-6A reductase [Anabaena sp. FACHB-1237]
MIKILILGGTSDAKELANQLANMPKIADKTQVFSSLAGRTRAPFSPIGNVRIGGFGGVDGLVNYLEEMQINILVDATHPFASQISENAATAAKIVNIPHLMLVRSAWIKLPDDQWLEVENNIAAAKVLASEKNDIHRVFLTIGRQEISTFAHLQNIWFLMRMIDLPDVNSVIPLGKILCDRGPFSLEDEKQILTEYKIDTIVSKNSGGNATYAKIIAARELGLKVIMVQRPILPSGEQVPDVETALQWLLNMIIED